jgi:hypothetical protein
MKSRYIDMRYRYSVLKSKRSSFKTNRWNRNTYLTVFFGVFALSAVSYGLYKHNKLLALIKEKDVQLESSNLKSENVAKTELKVCESKNQELQKSIDQTIANNCEQQVTEELKKIYQKIAEKLKDSANLEFLKKEFFGNSGSKKPSLTKTFYEKPTV